MSVGKEVAHVPFVPLFPLLEMVQGDDPTLKLEFLFWLLKVLSGWEFAPLLLASLCQRPVGRPRSDCLSGLQGICEGSEASGWLWLGRLLPPQEAFWTRLEALVSLGIGHFPLMI